jgi:hypothetical protein
MFFTKYDFNGDRGSLLLIDTLASGSKAEN